MFGELEKPNYRGGYRSTKDILMYWDMSRETVVDCLKTYDEKDPMPCFLLCVAFGEYLDRPRAQRIILRRTDRRGVFTRMGMFSSPYVHYYGGTELESAFDGQIDTLGEDDYLELHSTGHYTIEIT